MKHAFFGTRTGFIATAAATALLPLLGAAAAQAQAQTTLFNTGFEASEGYSTTISGPITVFQGANSTTFARAPGALFGQPRTNPFNYTFLSGGTATSNFALSVQNAVNSTTVVNTAAASGNQSVQLVGTTAGSQFVEYLQPLPLVIANNGVFTASLDVRVSNPSAAAFGQWGVEVLNMDAGFFNPLAAFGFVGGNVLASNGGDNPYLAINPFTGQPVAASYNAFNNYSVTLNYSTRTISGFFNNSPVIFVPLDASGNPSGGPVTALPFRADAGNTIGYLGFGQGLSTGSAETANFDNLKAVGVNVASAPEPGTLVLWSAGAFPFALGWAARRRKTF